MRGIYLHRQTDNNPDLVFVSKNNSAKITLEEDTLSFPSGISIGDTVGKVSVNKEGTLRLQNNATTFEDLRFPATAINPQGAIAAMSFDTINIGFTASPIADQSIAIIAQMPHAWKLGSIIYPHIHWQPLTSNTGNIVWKIEYKWTNIGAVEDSSWSTQTVVVPVTGGVGKHLISSFAGIDGTNKELSSLLTIKIYRLGTDILDTCTSNVLLKEFDIHYEIDSFGSNEQYIK